MTNCWFRSLAVHIEDIFNDCHSDDIVLFFVLTFLGRIKMP